MRKEAKRDIIAVVLLAFVICVVFLVTWINKTNNDSADITRFTDASIQLNSFVRNYDSLTPLELMTADLDPQTFIDAATYAPDQGTSNELQYIAELIARYNDGAGVEVLLEATALLNEVIPHFRETVY
ncbi:hypothetical protein PAECIP111893_04140 [Paenibacillus plantiphilus]|uniref:Uncharacterized protein n=1 Tax=Paenibacillus plantiphilus TaxID=2905650 RepID=A0ABM9CL84_9BACL|nr:hypothetical protein [Paenibacillus plantiphilus]CAH1216498.1 hypothetical protein PAECIP111893_04140 [Paenibacillus plantiphilus]